MIHSTDPVSDWKFSEPFSVHYTHYISGNNTNTHYSRDEDYTGFFW